MVQNIYNVLYFNFISLLFNLYLWKKRVEVGKKEKKKGVKIYNYVYMYIM